MAKIFPFFGIALGTRFEESAALERQQLKWSCMPMMLLTIFSLWRCMVLLSFRFAWSLTCCALRKLVTYVDALLVDGFVARHLTS